MNLLSRRAFVISLIALVILVIGIPLAFSGNFVITIIATGMLFAVLALSMDLLWGTAGILHLAPALSFGIGAYLWAILNNVFEGWWSTPVILVATAAIAAAVAGIVALVAFRSGVKDIYFALLTLALALAVQQIILSQGDVTGGSNGLVGIPAPVFELPGLFRLELKSQLSLYYFAGVLLIAALAVAFLVQRSRFGRVLVGLRENELRADALGYRTLWYKTAISMTSAAMAAVGGAIYGSTIGIVDPSVIGVALSIQVFVWVTLGGVGSLIGPIVIAVLLTTTQSMLAGSSATVYQLVTGCLFVLAVLFLPNGIASIPSLLKRKLAVK